MNAPEIKIFESKRGRKKSSSRQQKLTCGGLFAGIGGFCIGFERSGFETSWAIDFSRDAHDVYRLNFPKSKYLCSDIRTCFADSLEPVDVLHAGFPCQSFSGAGYRMGFEDERGKLFFEIPRLLREWANQRPKVVVMENSPYLKVGDGGAWFKTVITEIQRSGYWFSERNCFELDAKEHGGLPQRRKRLFMVAVRKDCFDFNGVDLKIGTPVEKKSLSTMITDEEVHSSYYLPPDNRYATMIGSQLNEQDPDQIYQLRKYLVRTPESGVCPTLTANMGKGGHNVPFIFRNNRLRKLTEYECLGLQGFPPGFRFPEEMSLARRYTLIGNAVSPSVSTIVANQTRKFINEYSS